MPTTTTTFNYLQQSTNCSNSLNYQINHTPQPTTILPPSSVPSSTNGHLRFSTDNNNANIRNKKTLSINVKTWSIHQVGLFIEKLTDTTIAKVFREQDINDRVLLLLTEKLLCRTMKIKLGPALIVLNEINKLRKQDGHFF